jgi:4a-hydroxytetrahydrobiopterin dehydratase
MSELCKGDVHPLGETECKELLHKLHDDWKLESNSTRLTRKVKTKDFKSAFGHASKVADLSEEQNHHPVLTIGYGFLEVKIWTHKIDALVESDFIYAAKADKILS